MDRGGASADRGAEQQGSPDDRARGAALPRPAPTARPGVVYLVGAGPGDPGLITIRAVELLASADVVLHDRLGPTGALARARPDAEIVFVGKRPGESDRQGWIEELMVDRARNRLSVVRLKGGDPFVFGRGGEEAEALRAAGVRYEVVPGVTAGIAGPAYAGIPVTHRADSSAVAFVTGHENPTKPGEMELDYRALAAFPGTLVFYMGVKRLPEIARVLIEAGRDPGEPAAAVERATLPGQRTITSTLADLPADAEREGLRAPAVVIAGPVVARREALAWLEQRPLHGLRVVVTRARAQASGLASILADLGAEVVELPTIRIVPRLDAAEVRSAVHDLHSYALVCLTSPNGVHLLFEAMADQGRDARALSNASVAAIGPGTAAALAERGVIADLVPERFVAESLVEALGGVEIDGRPVLVARAARARDVLPDALRERGARVDVVALYETVTEAPDAEAVEAAREADYFTFTSSSTVRNLVSALGAEIVGKARVVSIGPVTSATAREGGLTVHVEAERHEPEGLVEALLADAARGHA
jgi:uroporphyrinogen III methyltransferase/synthase